MLTDVSIDAAGNVWAANNWNDPIAATTADPYRSTSTWGRRGRVSPLLMV